MIYRARALVTMTGAPIENGAVVVESDRIRAAGPLDEITRSFRGPLEDLGDQVILPGLINAHCHLNYTMMRRAIAPPSSFTRWIRRINALKRSLDDDDYLCAIARGFEECRRWGTTTVLNIESFPELMLRMPPPPLRTWWFFELIDIRHRVATDEVVAGALHFFQAHTEWLGGFGLSPHAPYTASADLYRLANDCARVMKMPLTTHVAESRDEDEMFRHAGGDLFDLVAAMGRPSTDCGQGSSLSHLVREGLIGPGWILVHLNELDEDDFTLLRESGFAAQLHVAHCPRSHNYFNHRPFAFNRLRQLGLNIALGTDSLASNDSLNLFAEMQALQATEPALSSDAILRTTTTNAAAALGLAGQLGCISPGAHADLIALPFTGPIEEVGNAIVAHHAPIDWMLVAGRHIPRDQSRNTMERSP